MNGTYGTARQRNGVTASRRKDPLLKDNYRTHGSAGNALDLARGVHNETQGLIYPILKQYRHRIPSEFAEGSAILESLPGHTPAAVELSGAYDEATHQAVPTDVAVPSSSSAPAPAPSAWARPPRSRFSPSPRKATSTAATPSPSTAPLTGEEIPGKPCHSPGNIS